MADKQNVVQLIIEGNNVTAIKAIDGTVSELDKLKNKSSSMGDFMGNAFGSIQTKFALMGAAAVSAFGVMVKSAIDAADEINKLSQRTGVSAEQLSTMKYAAELSDVSIDKLATSFKFLNKNISDAADGGKESSAIFRSLGIEFSDTTGLARQADLVLYDIASKFKNLPDGADKASMALKLFGRSGEEIIPFLNAGADGIKRLQDEARSLGLEVSTNTAQQAERLNDSITRLERSINGVANQTLPGFVDFLADVTDGIYEMNKAAENAHSMLEILVNMDMNSIMEGIRKGEQSKKEALAEAITKAADLARQKMIGLTDTEVKYLAQQVNAKISTLKKLEPDENIQNDIAQLEAQLAVYNKRFQLTDEQKKKLEDIRKIESQITFETSLFGLNEFDKKLLEIKNKIDEWRSKGVKEPILSDYSVAATGELIKGVVDEGLAAAIQMDQEMNAEMMKSSDEELLLALNTSVFKKELWIDELELKKRLAEEETRLEDMKRQNYADSFGMMGDALMQFAQMSGNTNKGLFEAAKTFSIAEAIINTYTGATKALAQGGFLGSFMAASVIAMGMANVARIAATQPGSRGGGGVSYSSGSFRSPSYNNSVINNTNNNANSQSSYNITVNVNGKTIIGKDIPQWVRDDLSPEINKAIDDGLIKQRG